MWHAAVVQAIDAQALERPEAAAVRCGERVLSYGELCTESKRLAGMLRGRNIGPGDLVGVALDRSAEMVVALLAVLRAGAAYVPMDPLYPSLRLQAMLNLSGVTMLLSSREVLARLELDYRGEMVDVLRMHAVGAVSEVDPVAIGPHSTAYVIFTSGSTGQPKGVAVSHGSLTNVLESLRHRPGLTANDVLLAVTSVSFDIAVVELFLPLMVGARVELARHEDASDPATLLALARSREVTVMQATPVTWQMLLAAGWTSELPLRVWCGGEEMTRGLARELLLRSSSVWNLYGPTETTIWSSVHRVTSASGAIALGEPVANTQLYVLDEQRQPVGSGVVGELYIGGAGLATGYWRQPELTAEMFPQVRLMDGSTERLYRTGDRAARTAAGELQFFGRVDRQVKLRGFRIELAEIEEAVGTVVGLRTAVAIRVEDAGRGDFLALFAVAKPDAVLDAGELRKRLAAALPSYMMPAFVRVVDRLPLTPNGKVDRRELALRAAEVRRFAKPDLRGEAPRAGVEAKMAPFWSEVLRLPTVARDDNFFDLGGDSLSAARLTARMARMVDPRCSVALLLHAPTIAAYAAALSESVPLTSVVLHRGRPGRETIFWIDNPDRLQRLARQLGDRPFVSMLLTPDEIAREAPAYRIERLAARIVERIRSAAPRERVVIGGFCQNAALAYEVGCQLRDAGHEVPLLVLIDPGDLTARERKRGFGDALRLRVERERFHLARMAERPFGDWMPYLRRRYEGLRFEWEGRRWHRASARGLRPPSERPELAQALFVSRTGYRPMPYAGRVLLIQPTLRPAGETPHSPSRWRDLAPESQWVWVVADHVGLFESPAVESLSRAIRKALEQPKWTRGLLLLVEGSDDPEPVGEQDLSHFVLDADAPVIVAPQTAVGVELTLGYRGVDIEVRTTEVHDVIAVGLDGLQDAECGQR